jgi:predicted transcriptional regulator
VPPALHDVEAEVMDQVWRSPGEVTGREVVDALNATSSRQRAYTTVLTIMTRLEGKGFLRRRRDGKTDRYSPAIAQQDYLDTRARAGVSALLAEFGDVALAHFARQVEGLDDERREQLRRLADER